MIEFLIVLGIISALSILFVFCGSAVYRRSIAGSSGHPAALLFGGGYFIGMGLILTCWSLLDFFLINARLSLVFTIFIMISLGLFLLKGNLKKTLYQIVESISRPKFLLLFIFILVHVSTIFLWLRPGEPLQIMGDPNQVLGTNHSGWYVNRATAVMVYNRLPVISQNVAQSFLAAIPMLSGFNSPFLSLNPAIHGEWLIVTNNNRRAM